MVDRLRDAHAKPRAAPHVLSFHLRGCDRLAALPRLHNHRDLPLVGEKLAQGVWGFVDMYSRFYSVSKFLNIILIIGGLQVWAESQLRIDPIPIDS